MMLKKFVVSIISIFLITSCSSGSSATDKANKAVCQDISGYMEGSGDRERATRASLLTAATMISIYSPPAVEDWVTYVSPLKGDYVPSLYDNDNAVYQSLFRMQELALDYIYTKNSGRYLLEGRYYLERKLFLHFCGLETWK